MSCDKQSQDDDYPSETYKETHSLTQPEATTPKFKQPLLLLAFSLHSSFC